MNPVSLIRDGKDGKGVNTVVRSKKQGDIYAILKKSVKKLEKSQGSLRPSKLESVNLKEVILDEIVNCNIWTDEDLEALFERVAEQYSHLSEEVVSEAVSFVKAQVL